MCPEYGRYLKLRNFHRFYRFYLLAYTLLFITWQLLK
jgi:hypothetical protein